MPNALIPHTILCHTPYDDDTPSHPFIYPLSPPPPATSPPLALSLCSLRSDPNVVPVFVNTTSMNAAAQTYFNQPVATADQAS